MENKSQMQMARDLVQKACGEVGEPKELWRKFMGKDETYNGPWILTEEFYQTQEYKEWNRKFNLALPRLYRELKQSLGLPVKEIDE